LADNAEFATRFHNELVVYRLVQLMGVQDAIPVMVPRVLSVPDRSQTSGWLQTYGGSVLQDWVVAALDRCPYDTDDQVRIKWLLDKQPRFHLLTEQAFALRLAFGAGDSGAANFAVHDAPQFAVKTFDFKTAFLPNEIPFWDPSRPEPGMGVYWPLAQVFAGKMLSKALREMFERYLAKYDHPEGFRVLWALGLTHRQAKAHLERVRFLVRQGFPRLQGGA
jgi:hypothetical protein